MLIKNKNFAQDTCGAIAVNFALILTLLILCVGAAIDYSFMVKARTNLQNYADAAVLAAAVSGEENATALKDIAVATIKLQTTEDLDINLTIIETPEKTARVTVKSGYRPVIMGIFGHNDLNVGALSEAPIGDGKKLNLSLVLDTTRSMEGSRIDALKAASSELLNAIKQPDANSDNVKVSLVPFADYVKIDVANAGQPWLNVQPDHEITANRLDLDKSTGCDRIVTGENVRTECDTEVFKDETFTATWVGCMASRTDGYHKRPQYQGRKLQGPAGRTSCNANNNELLPLSTDLDGINTAIEGFVTNGTTYLPAGLIWGWRTLDKSLPFNESRTSNAKDTRNVLLLMTDGSNTASLNGERPEFDGIYHWGVGSEEATRQSADDLTTELCSSIKVNKIRVITVAFEVTDSDTLNLLKSCASSPADFYNTQNSNALKTAFQNIGSGLNEVRLSR